MFQNKKLSTNKNKIKYDPTILDWTTTKLQKDLGKDASAANIRKLLKDWETRHSFGYREYCMVAVYYLQKKLRAKP